jgi:hypothetical protein
MSGVKSGVALETAFVETYLGAVKSFSSTDLKVAAAAVGANEASHFSFFDAAFGGHGVLPSRARSRRLTPRRCCRRMASSPWARRSGGAGTGAHVTSAGLNSQPGRHVALQRVK